MYFQNFAEAYALNPPRGDRPLTPTVSDSKHLFQYLATSLGIVTQGLDW